MTLRLVRNLTLAAGLLAGCASKPPCTGAYDEKLRADLRDCQTRASSEFPIFGYSVIGFAVGFGLGQIRRGK
jgi:hypothetical protein